MEKNLGNQVDAYENGVPDNPPIIQHLFCVGRIVHHNIEDRGNPVECCDGHGQEEKNQQEGKQTANESILLWVNGIFSSTCGSPLVDEQHVPRSTHDSAVSKNCWCHKRQHGKGDPRRRKGAV